MGQVFAAVSGVAVNSSPTLNAAVKNVTCNGFKNGSIDLTTTGGTGPFTYQWTGYGTFDKTLPDISALSPNTYTVTITSYIGCSLTKSYTITQPDQLTLSLSADPMICKNTNAPVHVSATGGTLPYTGIGTFIGDLGVNSFTVSDSNGCTTTKSISVLNGGGVAPAKPAVINTITSDAQGLCGGGNFSYGIDSVATATYYTWTAPSGATISSTGNSGKQANLSVTAGFNSGNLTVTAGNACGVSSAQTKSLTNLPTKPASISGPSTVQPSQTGVVYSTPQIGNLTYTWTVPGGVTIVSGKNWFYHYR